MGSFPKAWQILKMHEVDPRLGPYTVDNGGPTSYGWRLSTVLDLGIPLSLDEFKAKDESWASDLAQQHFWNGFGDIVDDTVAAKMLDMAFNMEGPGDHFAKGRAVKIAQQALVDLGHAVPIDGGWGPQTCGALNAFEPTNSLTIEWGWKKFVGLEVPYDLLVAIVRRQAGFYKALDTEDHAQFGPYLDDWLERAAWPFKSIP